MTAQPPFSTNVPRSQLLPIPLRVASCAVASLPVVKRSTQTAAASSWRAPAAASLAMACAVPPVVQPPQVKPTTIVAATHATHDQKVRVLVGRAASQRCPMLCFVLMMPLRRCCDASGSPDLPGRCGPTSPGSGCLGKILVVAGPHSDALALPGDQHLGDDQQPTH